MNSRQLTKLSLRLFIVSVIASAVAGAAALAIPSSDWFWELRVLGTTTIIAAGSVCGLACGGCLSRGHRVLPIAGLVLTMISAGLLLIGLWVEVDSELFWKTSVSLSFYAVACAHLSMLYMANLVGVYRWSYLVAHQLILGLATLLAAGIVFEFFDEEGYIRCTGVVSILVAAITLLIPVFHYFSRDQIAAMRASTDPVFAVDEEIARLKKRLLELESNRQVLLGREPKDRASTNSK